MTLRTLSALLLLSCAAPFSPEDNGGSLNQAFDAAARESDVPRDLLVALAWGQTRLDDRGGEPNKEGGYGVMNLVPGGETGPDLDRAARLAGLRPQRVQKDAAANIRAAAALLRAEADELAREGGAEPERIEDWFEVLISASDLDQSGLGPSYARQTFRWIEGGLDAQSPDGEWVHIESRELDLPTLDMMPISASGDYSGNAQFVAASSANYTNSSRGDAQIDMVVIHTAQGSYAGTASWFQNSRARASAHYVVRSSDGEVTQMVWEADVAWHAGHSSTNSRSVGIELEGYIEDPNRWYTDQQMAGLAALVRDVADRNSIPLDRDHIIGHNEVPGCSGSGGGASCHTDPGSGFPWDEFMGLLGSSSGGGSSSTGGSSSGSSSSAGTTGALVGFVRVGCIEASCPTISGATVSLSTGASTTVRSDGYYEFASVTAGEVTVTASASGYTTDSELKLVQAGMTNWRSIALSASSSSSSGGSSGSGGSSSGGSSSSGGGSSSNVPGTPTDLSPDDWTEVPGDSVTLDWSTTGAASTSQRVQLYWWDGSTWQYYYTWSTTDSYKDVWPVIDETWWVWSAQSRSSAGDSSWSDWAYFYF